MSAVRAAGGVVTRGGEVLLVHRPRYGDWTFPKGKAEEGESDEDCARREVWEETGLHCELEKELASTDHVDAHGRPKHVRWWTMSVLRDDGFTPSDEVDEVRWVSRAEARALLTYPQDAALLD